MNSGQRKNRKDTKPCDLLKDEQAPLVHCFKTGQTYVYDVNTRRILKVSQVVWDVLPHFNTLTPRQLAGRFEGKYSPDDTAAAARQIELARREKGLFLSTRPEKVTRPPTAKIRKRLDSQREQLILNVTEGCNFRCSYCVYSGDYPDERTHSARSMTWPVAKAAIDDFLGHSQEADTRFISFYGGEPLLNLPLVRRCVTYVRREYPDVKLRFAMTTNAYLLKGKAAEFLAAEGFTLTISLDGPAQIHDRHRRTAAGRPTWARVMSNLRAFLKAHPAYKTNGLLRFNAVSTPDGDLEAVQDFLATCDLLNDAMSFGITDKKATEPPDLDAPPHASRIRLFADFLAALKSGAMGKEHAGRRRWLQTAMFQKSFALFHKRGFHSKPLPRRLALLNTCLPGVRRMFVSADGDYFACERVAGRAEEIIGNCRDGMNAPAVAAMLGKWNRVSGDDCRHCWCVGTCDVGCFATVGMVTAKAKRQACAAHRRMMHRLLEEYCRVLEANPTAFDYTSEIQFE